MWTEYLNESQSLLNRNIRGIGIALYGIFYLIVFSPLWFTAFMIARKLYPHIKGGEQVLIIFLISTFFYSSLFFLKGFLLFCKSRGKLIWILLFFICTGFACIAPAMAGFEMVHGRTHPGKGMAVSAILFCFTYAHYQFHAEGAPRIGIPAYHLGVSLASKII